MLLLFLVQVNISLHNPIMNGYAFRTDGLPKRVVRTVFIDVVDDGLLLDHSPYTSDQYLRIGAVQHTQYIDAGHVIVR